MAVLAVVGGTAATLTVQIRANRALLAKNQELTVANGREAKANADLAAANGRVEQRYELAMDAIKTFHTGVSEDFLLKEPQFKAIRDRLLNSARDFYEKLGRTLEGGTNPASRRTLLTLNFELADLAVKVGRPEDVLDLHRRVLAGREALASKPGADPRVKVEVSKSLLAVISLLKRTGQQGDVRPLLKRAVEFDERLAADYPGDPEAQDALASMLVLLGEHLKNVDYKREESERQFRRAWPSAKTLRRPTPRSRSSASARPTRSST